MAGRILVVDDDPDIRQMLQAIFSSEGWTVDEAADGPEALERYELTRPDVIILDQMMPGQTGVDVAEILRKDGCKVPIVLFSAYLSTPVRTDCEQMDVWPISKVDLNALVRVVRGFMQEAAGTSSSPN